MHLVASNEEEGSRRFGEADSGGGDHRGFYNP